MNYRYLLFTAMCRNHSRCPIAHPTSFLPGGDRSYALYEYDSDTSYDSDESYYHYTCDDSLYQVVCYRCDTLLSRKICCECDMYDLDNIVCYHCGDMDTYYYCKLDETYRSPTNPCEYVQYCEHQFKDFPEILWTKVQSTTRQRSLTTTKAKQVTSGKRTHHSSKKGCKQKFQQQTKGFIDEANYFNEPLDDEQADLVCVCY